jgi:uncharacterized protein involved in exopolysaccharide biosynthesis
MNDNSGSGVARGTGAGRERFSQQDSALERPRFDDGEISLLDVARLLWRHKTLILTATILCGVIGAAGAYLITPTYRAEVLLSPVEPDGPKANLGGLASQLGAFASLAGVSGSKGSEKEEALATLQSRLLTDTFVTEENLLPILFADKWDAAKQGWKTSDPKKIPTLWDANKLFTKSIRQVVQDRKTNLVTLAIVWKDPKIAAAWANDLVRRTNLYLRSKAITRSNTNIDYLKDQLTKTSVVEIHQALNSLIEDEIKKVMLAQGTEEYAFSVVDPAVVPEEISSPKHALIALGGAVLGFLVSAMVAMIRSSKRLDLPISEGSEL